MNTKKKNNEFMEFIKTVVGSFVIVYLVTTFLFRPVRVHGSSMYPALKDGEYGISNVISRKLNGINRFDIVIVHIEENNEFLVKRVIGLPGEIVSYKNDQLYINGEAIDEPFLDEEYKKEITQTLFTGDIDEYIVPLDEYYCLGDNRMFSRDSRFYGSFKSSQIVCKDIFVIFPLENFGQVKKWN